MAKDKNNDDLLSTSHIAKGLNNKINETTTQMLVRELDVPDVSKANKDLSKHSSEFVKRNNIEIFRYFNKLCEIFRNILFANEKAHQDKILDKERLNEYVANQDAITKFFEMILASAKMQEERLLVLTKMQLERLRHLEESIKNALKSLDEAMKFFNVAIQQCNTKIANLNIQLNNTIVNIGQTITNYASHPIKNFQPTTININLTNEERAKLGNTKWDAAVILNESDGQEMLKILGKKVSSGEIDYRDLANGAKKVQDDYAKEKIMLACPFLPREEREQCANRNLINFNNSPESEKFSTVLNEHIATRDKENNSHLQHSYENAAAYVNEIQQLNDAKETIENMRDRLIDGRDNLVKIHDKMGDIRESEKCSSADLNIFEEGGSFDDLLENINNLCASAENMKSDLEITTDNETSPPSPSTRI